MRAESEGIAYREDGFARIPNISVAVGSNSSLEDRKERVSVNGQLWHPSKFSVKGSKMITMDEYVLLESKVYIPFAMINAGIAMINAKAKLKAKKAKNNACHD